jgi:hypothetical protein
LYDPPQYGDPNLGFAITAFRVDHKFYDYADQCFRLLGKEPVRECGVTMSVSFDTPEENDAFRDNFKLRVEQAEKKLDGLGNRTPQEYYFLKCSPVIIDTEDGQNNHYVFLQATVEDDFDREMCQKILGDCKFDGEDGTVDIKVSCYRKKWRNKIVSHLVYLGVDSRI